MSTSQYQPDIASCNDRACQYSCQTQYRNSIDSSYVVTNLVLSYRYEVWVRVGDTNLSEELLTIEEKILENLSTETKLTSCEDLSGPQLSFDSSSAYRYQDFALNSEIITRISSNLQDVPDYYDDICNIPSSIQDITCIPIKGEMEVGYESAENSSISEENVKHAVFNLIEKGMHTDLFTTDNIVQVSFAGEREEVDGDDNSSMIPTVGETLENTSNPLKVGMISTASMAAMFILGAALFAKKKLRKNKEAHIGTLSPRAGKKNGLRNEDFAKAHGLEDSDDNEQRVVDPVKAKYDIGNSDSFYERKEILSTISEASIETDTSAANESEHFERILSESTYEDNFMGRYSC